MNGLSSFTFVTLALGIWHGEPSPPPHIHPLKPLAGCFGEAWQKASRLTSSMERKVQQVAGMQNILLIFITKGIEFKGSDHSSNYAAMIF